MARLKKYLEDMIRAMSRTEGSRISVRLLSPVCQITLACQTKIQFSGAVNTSKTGTSYNFLAGITVHPIVLDRLTLNDIFWVAIFALPKLVKDAKNITHQK